MEGEIEPTRRSFWSKYGLLLVVCELLLLSLVVDGRQSEAVSNPEERYECYIQPGTAKAFYGRGPSEGAATADARRNCRAVLENRHQCQEAEPECRLITSELP
jgi:hypothetical protein